MNEPKPRGRWITDSDIKRFKDTLTPLSDRPLGHWIASGERIMVAQRVDSINLGELDDMVMNPALSAPSEVFFYVGRQVHRIMSQYGMPGVIEEVKRIAEESGIEIKYNKQPVDTEQYPWVHAQWNLENKLVGLEEIGPSLLRDFEIHERAPMTPGQERVSGLTVIYHQDAQRI